MGSKILTTLNSLQSHLAHTWQPVSAAILYWKTFFFKTFSFRILRCYSLIFSLSNVSIILTPHSLQAACSPLWKLIGSIWQFSGLLKTSLVYNYRCSTACDVFTFSTGNHATLLFLHSLNQRQMYYHKFWFTKLILISRKANEITYL